MALQTDLYARMALRDRTLALIQSSAAQKIEFTFNGVYFAGRYFNLVANAIMSKWVGGQGVGFRTGHVSPNAAAQYDPGDDVIDVTGLAYGVPAFERQALVHESFHAWRDVMGAKVPGNGRNLLASKAAGYRGMVNTAALQDEAMAYVTGALFNIYDTTSGPKAPTVPWWATGTGPYAVAHTIATSIWNIKGVALKDADVKAMTDVVKGDGAYTYLKSHPNHRYDNNGV
jgi:hypothetical protein